MYFGSVRFFKHLIVTVILLLIIIPVTVSIALSGQLKEKDLEIEELYLKKDAILSLLDIKNGDIDISSMTAEDFHTLLNKAGIKDKELIEVVFKNNEKLLNEVLSTYNKEKPANTESASSKTSLTTTPSESTAKAPVTDEPVTETIGEDIPTAVEILPEYQSLYPDLYVSTAIDGEYEDDENYIYLTFDDGPSSNTSGVLKYLNQHGVKATFFVIPDESENCKKYLNEMLQNGHAIGIHTMSHDYVKIYESVESYLEDFYAAFKTVEEQTGYRPFLFRFPGGSKNDYNIEIYNELVTEMTRRGFIYFDWNIDSGDALGANWTQMYNTVQTEVPKYKRSVILFHDGPGRENTVLVIEDIISVLQKDSKYYTFSAISEKTRPLVF